MRNPMVAKPSIDNVRHVPGTLVTLVLARTSGNL